VTEAATAVVAYVPDLIDRSKLQGVPGVAVRFVARPAALPEAVAAAGPCAVVVVDLARPGVLDAVRAVRAAADAGPAPRIVGFGSHVDRELLAAGLTAGCDESLPRSAFFGRLADVLAGRPAS
jgi:DNA-binding NarL/FixJ family response regulator